MSGAGAGGPQEAAVRQVRVLRTARVGRSFVRVTLALDDDGPGVVDRGWDSWVRLFMPRRDAAPAGAEAPLVLPLGPSTGWYARWKELPEQTRAEVRNETVRALRDGGREIDLDLVVHTGPDGAVVGPAGRWATAARPGERAGLLEQGTIIDDALGLTADVALDGPLVVLADEAGVPAAESTARSLAAGSRAVLLLEVPHAEDARELASAADVEVRWLVRPPGAPSGSAALTALADLAGEHSPGAPALPPLSRVVAVGERGAVAGARHRAVSLGVPVDRVRACPYWLLDRPRARRAG